MIDKTLTQKDVTVSALARMEERGLDYGSFFPMDFLKEIAGPWGDDDNFRYFIMGLTMVLRQRGFIFTCSELNGEGYRIPQQVENYHYTQNWHDSIDRSYSKIITLMSNMKRDQMTETEKKRDDNWLRLMRHERMMLRRATDAIQVIKKNQPGFLKEDQEINITIED